MKTAIFACFTPLRWAGPGYDVDGAKDGEAGWDALQSGHYNLLITENELPYLTGLSW